MEVSDAYMVHLPNKPAPTLSRHIILRDLRYYLLPPSGTPSTFEAHRKYFYLHNHFVSGCSYSEMKVTLWGQRAAAFTTDGVYDSVQAKPIVVLFVGGLVKSY